MSLAAWKKKHYPVEAKKVPKSKALAHSLQKWLGLLPSVLKRYGLEVGEGVLAEAKLDGETLEINDTSCALCRHFDKRYCKKCPLGISLGERCDTSDGSPYWAFVDNNDPKPMIAALKQAVKEQAK